MIPKSTLSYVCKREKSEENSYNGFDANVRFFRHFNSLGAKLPNKLMLSFLYSLCIMMDMSGLIPLSFLPDSTRFVSIQQPGYSNVMTTSLPRPKATRSVMVAQETVTQPRTHATRDDSKSIWLARDCACAEILHGCLGVLPKSHQMFWTTASLLMVRWCMENVVDRAVDVSQRMRDYLLSRCSVYKLQPEVRIGNK